MVDLDGSSCGDGDGGRRWNRGWMKGNEGGVDDCGGCGGGSVVCGGRRIVLW